MRTAVDVCPTRNVQHILQMVDGIYAAGCGEATWDWVLARICRFGSLDGAALSTVGAVEPRQLLLASFNLAVHTNRAPWHGATPDEPRLVDSILRSPAGTVLRSRQIMSDPATAGSRWTGSAPVNGSTAWACVVVGKDGRRPVCLEVHGARQAPGCPEPHDLLRVLAPHLVRAWRLCVASRPAAVAPLRVAARSSSDLDLAPGTELAGLPETARLRAEFGLTKAEARLALYLAEGLSLASAAQAFDVKLTTIRSQLQQVFAKTGTSRQTELVAMLLGRGYGLPRLQWSLGRPTQPELAFAG